MIDLSPQQIGDLDPEQLEFLLRRLKKAPRKDGGEPGRQAIPRREGSGPWALSFAQQRLWFIHQLEQRSAAYHIPIAVDLAGPLRPPLLAAALEEVARRHEVLRTTFDRVDGHPVQVIRPGLALSLPEVDLSGLERRAWEAELARLAGEEAVRPFDLVSGPLLRGVLVRKEAGRFRLLLTLHHVAADNWSVAVLMREVSAFYDAQVTGIPLSLPELPVQYADFAVWQRGWLQGEVLERQLAFWRGRLDGAPRRLDLPADRPRPEVPSFRSGRLVFRLPEELTEDLKALGRERGTTLYNTLLAAWNALLARYAGQEDLVVGSPVANRRHTEIEGLIGFFVNTLLMRNRPEGGLAFEDFLASVHEASLGAFAHQDLPFEKIVEDLRPDRDSSYQPLFQVMFNVYDGAMPELRFAGLEVEAVEVQIGTWNDLDLLLVDSRQGLEGYLRYSADLFEPETAEAIADSFRELLATIVRVPRTPLADLPLSPALTARAEAARRRERNQLLAVSATFTADPLADSLAFWMKELDIPSRIEMAPYNQVFQQLLDPGSLLNANRHGVNVVLVRLEDFAPEVERNIDDLSAALEQVSRSAAVPFLLVLCPSEPARAEAEERLRSGLQGLANVYLATGEELSALYPVENLYDPYTDRIGHVPYTLTGFAALGTLLARKIHALSSPPAKVIVLDCDNTLWKGVCGEDGPHGVILDPARKRLQEIVLAQQREGILLCLCSKNEEEDVWAAFAERPDFPLQREHLAAWRINWLPKSENLKSLARELDLGLDSFVFVDDNPVECAEVRAGCPEVMVLPLPGDDGAIPRTLEHFWAFDRLRTTAEDRERTALYRQAAERERHRRSAASFEEFLAGLGLAIDVSSMAPEQLARVAQLTQRTNQFNASTVRRAETEIRRLLDDGALECRVVEVQDRFGDYGLVGVALFAAREDALLVDTFLLSCRVLGRGVEHRVLAVLGEEAAERGLGRVDVLASPTAKNRPAFDFLRSVAGVFEDGSVFRIPVDVARAASFVPSVAAGEDEEALPATPARATATPDRSRRLLRIAAELFDPREVQRLLEEGRRHARTAGAGEPVAPRTATEERLAAIFAEVLGVERVGVRDSFFDLGGHSLLGTVVLSRVRDAFGVELPVLRLFQSPTVEALAAAVEEAGSPVDGAGETIDRISTGTGPFSPSYPQEALWFLHQLEPDSPAYNIPMALRLAGRLRRGAFERSLREIVRRHWTLRTLFTVADGRPVQEVAPSIDLNLPDFDLSGMPDGERESELRRHISEEARRPFDLAKAPLFRVGLLRLAPEEHVVYLVVHHTVFDGWSMGVMVRELVALYGAFAEGASSPLPELPIQYVDFARWQRERMEKGSLEPQLAYWREALNGLPESLELPTDRPRPAYWSFHGASRAVELPARLVTALAEAGRAAGASLFMALLAGFQALLFRYTGQSDVAIGSPIANRNRSEVEGLIGFFANTLVLRLVARPEEGFAALLTEARRVALAAYAHQDLPFEKLVEELRPGRNPSRSPLFQVLLALQNAPLPKIRLPELTLSILDLERTTARFDLLLTLVETEEGGLRGLLEYSTDLFEAVTAARITHLFRNLLEAVVEDPRRPLAEAPLLAPGERFQLLAEWNDTARVYPQGLSLHQLFEAQAASSPDAVAVRFEGQSLSYGDLDRRSGRLAHRLRAHGVGPDTIAGVLLDRSFEMVVSVLAVLKAGGAYLPLDPGNPRERLAFFVADAAPRVVVTVREHADLLPAGSRTVLLDASGEESATPLAVRVDPDHLAYVIYTSGSTGRPKAAMNTHRALVNRLQEMQEAYGLEARDRVLQKTAFSFDVAVWEILWPLIAGAAVVMARPEGHRDPGYLAGLIAREGITTLHFVPSMLRAFLETAGVEGCSCLRRVYVGGEELTADLAERASALFAGARIYNFYGPAEAAIEVTAWEHRRGEAGPRVPIGRPIANVRIHLLDREGHLVPVGVPGELYAGGAGVGRGYLGKPDLTAERFVPDPFAPDPGACLYRTGDLARHRADGAIEFLGRIDHQVKIRGVRIELQEIEAMLKRIPGVTAAAVLAREHQGERRLAGYVVPRAGETLAAADLRRILRETLPEPMVPAVFVFLEAMPLNPNGKLDRKALPEPEAPERTAELVPPRNLLEELVAGIWSAVLGIDRLSVEDNVFDLGAHSLLATQVLTRINRELGLELPLRRIFEHPTVALLAAEIERHRERAAERRIPPIRPVPRDGGMPLSFAQQRLWFFDRWEPGSAVFNLPTAVRLDGILDISLLTASLHEVVRRHETLRCRFLEAGGEPVQVIDPFEPRPFPLVDLSELPRLARENEEERLRRDEARRPFDLEAGPLLRATLLRLSDREHLALLSLHHIVADGWSLWVLTRELSAAYEGFAAGRRPSLPELPVQFADYAAWQRSWLEGEVLAEELAFWKELLADAPDSLDLPFDRPRGPVQRYRGGRAAFSLSRELTARLRGLCRELGATLFMVLATAWKTLLWRYSNQPDVTTGTVIANRHRREVEGLIGLFINTLVLRTRLEEGESFRQAIPRVREMMLDVYAHQDVPFEKLVHELNPERHLSLTPLFQVMLILQNMPSATLELPGLRLEVREIERNLVNYDLLFFLEEKDGGLTGVLDYDVDLFDAATVLRLLSHWESLLSGVADDPGGRLLDTPLLGEPERQHLLREWNDTRRASSSPLGTFSEMFEEQASLRPEAWAASCCGERITYRDLSERVDRMARALAARGVGRDAIVPVLSERGVGFLTAILAILRCGAAYLPLDPTHPERRIGQILASAGVSLALASRNEAGKLRSSLDTMAAAGRPRIEIVEDLGAEASRPGPAPVRGLPENLAYVIFTSGSTGQPKGVLVEARGLVNNVRSKVEDLPLSADDVVAQTASQCFDISVWQFLAVLAAGGTVRIVPDEVAHDPWRLLEEVEGSGVTVLEIVPSLLQAVLDETDRLGSSRPPLARLRWVMPTGEAVPSDLCRRWLGTYPGVPLLNLYGPSECSDDVSTLVIAEGWEAGHAITPIGRPLRNARLYIVDPHLTPAPVGVVGELSVGGICVGRGYLADPARTAGSLVPDALSGEPGARFYRTGDMARYLPDGRVEFLGRVDHQVKIRGFRIEIGEIEAVLRQHEEVAQAVVVARREGGSARLVGYVAASPGEEDVEGLTARLRSHLAERLPDYMVPAVFVVLDRLPLSPNGKIDRKALPAPDLRAGAVSTPPRTRTERELADIWREVLKREEIGIEESFFDLGGHSLLAIQVLSRLRAALGVEIPLRDLFEATTVETLAARVDAALGSRSDLATVPIPPAPAGEDLPLSFSQERLWFLEQLDPGNPAYNLPSAVLVTGEADPAVFAGVLNEIVRRHAALRTTFMPAAGRPRQIVHESLPVGFPVIDLAELPPSAREEETVRVAIEDARRPFDLERGPLLRALLLRRGAAEHVLILDMHHIVSDAWSMGVFLTEVAALYPALAEGRPPRLPELPVQYPDYACWQRETLQGEVLERQLGFWKQQLAGAPPALDLPGRGSRPARLDPRHGGTRWFRLPDALAGGLQVASRQRGTTLFMTLSAGFAALLSRYSGASDLMIGVPVAGRGRTELERLIGFFVNTLVLRADLAGAPSVGELLQRVRRATLDSFSHQDLPFEKLVAEVNPDRDLDRSPLFQVMFALQNAPAERIELPGLTLRRLEIETGTTRFEMFLEMTENGGGLEGALHYSTDLFEAPFVARLLGHFEALLGGMAADPSREVSSLPLLSAAERAQLLLEWNDSAGEAPLDLPFQRLFEERVARHPDRIAALHEGEILTYAGLDRRANGLARRLIEEGVGAEGVVAILAERGLDFLAAVLGVFKAGGAYLPLDPHHPPGRIRQVLEQSRSSLVLAAGGLLPLAEEALAGFAGVRPAVLELVPSTAEAPPVRSGSENLAYVIFTSGSTGVPKGAMLVHRGMINHLFAKIAELGLTENDVVAQTASQCFDISVWQLLAALTVGGRVRIYADDVAHDPAVLLDRVEEDGVTVLETVPSLMRLMLAEIGRRGGSAPALPDLRWLIPTGEALPPELCREWHRVYPHAALLNAYGPTECSDDVSHHRVGVEETEEARIVPIGRPILNTELYVMDAGLRPALPGVAGELCVGGEGVGRGYLFDPGKTAGAFVPDPCSYRRGARLYRTGDLARLRPDGNLEFLGRIDHQVKIRGFRLELGEIEALLGEHPGLAAIVVTARPEPSGVQRLVAYVVPRPEAEIASQDLREFLKSRLPEYAIPTAWVTLDRLPLTPNGKVDRRALPDVDSEGPGADRPYVEPRSEVEAAVAEIFAAVIGVERVGAFDNFFDLGGHSLLATQATWRLRETFGVELALRAVFEAPTVAELAGVIEDKIIEQIESLSEDEVDSLLEEDPEALEALRWPEP
jgi:amino acid adenylation domain-containing protein/FkbH-like protein